MKQSTVIVTFRKVPLSLAPFLFSAIESWHETECGRPGCRPKLRAGASADMEVACEFDGDTGTVTS